VFEAYDNGYRGQHHCKTYSNTDQGNKHSGTRHSLPAITFAIEATRYEI
jgi:hypothetical protein